MKKLTKREKILLGVSIVGAGVAGYLGFKCYGYKNKILEKDIDRGKIVERLNFLEFLVIESECVPKAKQNGTNKLAREESKIKGIIDAMIKHPNDDSLKTALIKHEAEAKAIIYQLENIYKLEEAVKTDQNIYAK